MISMTQLIIGFLLACGVAGLAYRLHSLNRSGALAAALMGTVIFGLGSWRWAVLLLAFFISSSALSRTFQQRKRGLSEKFSKGDERDAGQVLGNGGLATAFVIGNLLFPNSPSPWIGFAAALAAVNADTWATELGVLNPTPPYLITNPSQQVEKGTSGGISLLGTAAALAGSALIAALAVWFGPASLGVTAFFGITLAGLAGALFDSFLGATVQAMYFCPADQKETEKHPLHTCGAPTLHIRGWRWLQNDWVNFACSLVASLIALVPFWIS